VFNTKYRNIVEKVCRQLILQQTKQKKLFCLISGPQGSGKTTFTDEVKKKLTKKKLKVLVLSIDDFYFGKKDRNKLSKTISSLLVTRGVPGTHNLQHLKNVLRIFLSKKKKIYLLPKFSKAEDDILKSQYHKLTFPYDIFILEGWCINYPGEPLATLKKPINSMEKECDKNLQWRKYVNKKSKEYFKAIYQKSNCSIFLKIPSFKYVFQYRKKQELGISKNKRMTDVQLKHFINFYERITKNLLVSKNNNFDIEITIKPNHDYTSLKQNIS
jgi:D-glycerate 3-kinase